ncbi:hypothetical protein CLIB1423_10S02806 [[Candida] railenensis]|uniref:Tubulin-folding cofactor D ARM repeats domain-containing protein n=1 Tax=[Candida] railenensis TaxID=45579 RepID=A0A9P0QS17_9ASCO|nr:hypothetical protein CLIB1423_10S02806 [[Candida] railenensis]
MDQFLEESLLKKNSFLHSQINERIELLVSDVGEELVSAQKVHLVRLNRIQAEVVRIQLLIQEFEPNPKLLDKYLSVYITKLSNLYLEIKNQASSKTDFRIEDIIYSLSKIRGFKNITNYFSSEVYLFPKLLKLKESFELHDNEQFLILLWLSNLVLVPFELDKIQNGLSERLYDVALRSLGSNSNGSKIQVVSSILLSRLVTRADQGNLLDGYFYKTIKITWKSDSSGSDKLGHLITLNKIMKRSSTFDKYFEIVEDILAADYDILAVKDNKANFTNMNILYIIKLSDRLCSKYYLENMKYEMVANTINSLFRRVLLAPVLQNKFDVNLRYAFARALSNICYSLDKYAMNYQDQLVHFVLEEFDIPNLQMAKMLFQHDLFISPDYISISKYHTLLLTMGHLSLRKCLPTRFIPTLLSIVHKTLFFSQRRLTVTVGTAIRDSSCFILWAICRSVQLETFAQILAKSTIDTILLDIINVCIFDQDLVIRRCGIAVLQEYIGRFGNSIFDLEEIEDKGKFIINFIQLFDNHSIGSSSSSYSIVPRLVEMGFHPCLFIPTLISNICDAHNTFENKKLNAFTLVGLMSTSAGSVDESLPIGLQQINPEKSSLHSVTAELTSSVLYDETGPLYALSKLIQLQGENDLSFVSELKNYLESIHFDSSEKGEEFLSFMTSLRRLQSFPISEILELKINEVVKSSHSIGVTKQCQEYFSLAPQGFHGIDNVIALIKKNNLNSANSVGYFRYIPPAMVNELIEIVKDTNLIQVETRAAVQSSLSYYYKSQNNRDLVDLDSVLQSLDDYTTTTQGDVGSKLRSSTILLLVENSDLYEAQFIEDEVIPRIIRISCEPLTKLRLQSRHLLNKLQDSNEISEKLDVEEYYIFILKNYHTTIRKDYKVSFWSGYVFSTGGASNRSTINASVNALMKYFQDYPSEEAEILTILLNLLVPPAQGWKLASPRLTKRYSATLNLISILLESNSIQSREIDFLEKIFVRSYNLHINTGNMDRILQVISIFQNLGIQGTPVSSKATKRLSWLACRHPVPLVRLTAGESLYEIATDKQDFSLCHELEGIQWEEEPSKTNLKLEEIYKRFGLAS